jgi:hypothetical protein
MTGTKENFWAYVVGAFSAKITLKRIGCYNTKAFKISISETIWKELLRLAKKDEKVKRLMRLEGLI